MVVQSEQELNTVCYVTASESNLKVSEAVQPWELTVVESSRVLGTVEPLSPSFFSRPLELVSYYIL